MTTLKLIQHGSAGIDSIIKVIVRACILLLPVLCRVKLIDTRPEICGIPTECDIQLLFPQIHQPVSGSMQHEWLMNIHHYNLVQEGTKGGVNLIWAVKNEKQYRWKSIRLLRLYSNSKAQRIYPLLKSYKQSILKNDVQDPNISSPNLPKETNSSLSVSFGEYWPHNQSKALPHTQSLDQPNMWP